VTTYGLPGKAADVVVLAPETIADRATYAEPQRYPDGIRTVLVGGRVVVEEGSHRGTRAGEVLRAGHGG
jgi:N-acyl-D-aspartate/D-glutamate deacylase